MSNPLPCSIIGFDESRELTAERNAEGVVVDLTPSATTHRRSLSIQLPDLKVINIDVTEEVLATVLKSWKNHVENILLKVGDVVMPDMIAWRAYDLSGYPQAFVVQEVIKGYVRDDGAHRRSYSFAGVINITKSNRPPSLEPLLPNVLVIPSYEAWVRKGLTGLPVVARVFVGVSEVVTLKNAADGLPLGSWNPKDLHRLE